MNLKDESKRWNLIYYVILRIEKMMPNFLSNIFKTVNSSSKYVNFTIFLLTFLIGLTYIYCFDYNRKVEVYPSPHTIDKIEYKDEAEHCFAYKIKDVKCPSDKKKIEMLP